MFDYVLPPSGGVVSLVNSCVSPTDRDVDREVDPLLWERGRGEIPRYPRILFLNYTTPVLALGTGSVIGEVLLPLLQKIVLQSP